MKSEVPFRNPRQVSTVLYKLSYKHAPVKLRSPSMSLSNGQRYTQYETHILTNDNVIIAAVILIYDYLSVN
jgi:hypothetical protein